MLFLRILTTLVICLFVSCKTVPNPVSKEDSLQTENWAEGDMSNIPQILLTNQIDLKGYPSKKVLASSFLIHTNGKTFALTAQHLLGPQGGYREIITKKQLKDKLIEWKLHPRGTEKIVNQNSTYIKSLKNSSQSKHDILVFNVWNKPDSIFALRPSLAPIETGANLILLGCPYNQSTCTQNVYFGEYGGMYNDYLWVMNVEGDFNFSGYSGAPILNESGHCVGVLYGGRSFQNGITPLLFSPLTLVREYIE